jgi:hypothetical protein
MMTYRITHGRRPNWSRTAETLEQAREIIRRECGGYMDDEPHFNDGPALELWNESADEGCETYAIEEMS